MTIKKKEPEAVLRLKERIQRDEPAYIDDMMKEIRGNQPFLLSLCGGIIQDTTTAVANDMAQILLLVWGFFREYSAVWKAQITTRQYERIQNRSIAMLQYGQGEKSRPRAELYGQDIKKLRSTALFADIAMDVAGRKKLAVLGQADASTVCLGIKCLIECFEEIIYGSGEGQR